MASPVTSLVTVKQVSRFSPYEWKGEDDDDEDEQQAGASPSSRHAANNSSSEHGQSHGIDRIIY